MFHQHVDFYANKSISTVKCMKILSNSNCGINFLQKCLLYRTCILPIMLYRFQLWFYNHAPIAYHLKSLSKIQKRAAIWILGAFKTSPSYSIEAITGLIPIKLSNHISFYVHNKGKDDKSHVHQLDNIVLESSSSPSTAIIVSNVSIKNNVAISILYMHINNKTLIKTIHHTVHVISTKAELVAIRYGVNQTTKFNNMSKIIVVTNSIHATRKIFESSVHSY